MNVPYASHSVMGGTNADLRPALPHPKKYTGVAGRIDQTRRNPPDLLIGFGNHNYQMHNHLEPIPQLVMHGSTIMHSSVIPA
jgi:hypothetical protein